MHTLISCVVIGVVLICSQALSAAEYVLAKDGKANCAIVLPPDASAPMEYGAKDLSNHLELISGAKFTVYRQNDLSDLPKGYTGIIEITDKRETANVEPGREEYYITTKPGKPWSIRIYGDNQRGALYGCYGLLQDVLGCRWFTQGVSHIPRKNTLAVGELTIHQKPSFELRDPYFYEALMSTEWAVRNRINGSQCKLDDTVGGKVIYGTMIAHTMLHLVPPEKYFEDHPEYFALVNGKRVNDKQLCLTNSGALKVCIERIKELIKQNPKANIYSVSQMDLEGGACQCDDCREIVEKEGSESGPILAFVNAVSEEISKDYPEILIETLAYNYSQKPPKHIKPAPNVRVMLCLPWTCKAHRLDDVCNEEPYNDLLAWSKITNQLYIWDYITEFNDYMMLHPSLRYVKSVYDIFNKTGVVGVFMLGSYNSSGGAMSEMKAYLSARLMWDHTLDPDKLLDEYVNGVYGESAAAVMKWITIIHEPFLKNTGKKMLGIYDTPNADFLSKDMLDKSEEMLDTAERLCFDDAEVATELGKIRMWTDYTRIAQIVPKLEVKNKTFSYGVTDSDLERIDRWLMNVEHKGVERTAEGQPLDISDLVTRNNAAVECETLENDQLRLDIVPSLGGKIVRLISKPANKELLVHPKSVFKKTEGGYEGYVVSQGRGTEFTNANFSAKKDGDKVILTGISPDGRGITKEYQLVGSKLTIKTTVRNTTQNQLDVQIWESPRLAIRDFKEISVEFENIDGDRISLSEKDFSINWADLNKKYKDNEKPAGQVAVRLRNAAFDIEFDPDKTEVFNLFNNGGLPTELLSPELHCKPVKLEPGETTSFEVVWTINP